MGDSAQGGTVAKIEMNRSVSEDFHFSLRDNDECNMNSSHRADDKREPKEIYIERYNGSSPSRSRNADNQAAVTTQEELDDVQVKVKPIDKRSPGYVLSGKKSSSKRKEKIILLNDIDFELEDDEKENYQDKNLAQ
jgi:hypothetical protein